MNLYLYDIDYLRVNYNTINQYSTSASIQGFRPYLARPEVRKFEVSKL
jgi:hypothetical protein